MGKRTLQGIVVFVSCLSGVGGLFSVAYATPARPLVVIFPSPPEEDTSVRGVAATPQSPDGLLDAQRTQLAVRAMRDRFAESNVANAVIYSPEAPVFVRAALEAKLQLKNAAVPVAADRLALGKAIEAVSVMTIRAQPRKESPGSVEVILEATDVESRKQWSDKIVAGSVLSTLPTEINVGNDGTRSTPVENTSWMSASNTLVLRYLAGPLGEYTRALAPPGIVTIPKTLPTQEQTPPVVTPEPQIVPAPLPSTTPTVTVTTPQIRLPQAPTAAQNEAAQTARQQADAFIAAGDTTSAIVILRKAVNQVPRSLPLRTALAQAYLSVGRASNAADEARRALSVAGPETSQEARAETVRVLAGAYAKSGDSAAAKNAYEEILTSQPQALWARIALGDLLMMQGDSAGAESAYRAVRQTDPTNREALLGIARTLIARGDYSGAMAEVSQSSGSGSQLATVFILFDEIAIKTGDAVTQNRQAFDNGQLSREAIFKATQGQSTRISNLLALLVSAAPPAGSSEGITSPYVKRKLAATLLSQAVGATLDFLESGDKKAGEQAKLLLSEFRKELNAAR